MARTRHALLIVLLLTPACSDGTARDASGSAAPSAVPTSGTAEATEVDLPMPGDGFAWRLTMSPDGRTAVYGWSQGFFPRTRESSIYTVSRAADGGWGQPEEVSFVGEDSEDLDPVFSADGTRLWFSSIRPVDGAARTDVDVWYVDRAPGGAWGEPVNAGAANSPKDDLYPSLAADGSLHVGSDRGGAGFDLWRAPQTGRTWGAAVRLPEPVSTTTWWEFNPAFSPDGTVLVFTARGRDGGQGEGDLFYARQRGTQWSEPVPLDSANTASDEYHPSFSADGGTLYLVRRGKLVQLPTPSELTG